MAEQARRLVPPFVAVTKVAGGGNTEFLDRPDVVIGGAGEGVGAEYPPPFHAAAIAGLVTILGLVCSVFYWLLFNANADGSSKKGTTTLKWRPSTHLQWWFAMLGGAMYAGCKGESRFEQNKMMRYECIKWLAQDLCRDWPKSFAGVFEDEESASDEDADEDEGDAGGDDDPAAPSPPPVAPSSPPGTAPPSMAPPSDPPLPPLPWCAGTAAAPGAAVGAARTSPPGSAGARPALRSCA